MIKSFISTALLLLSLLPGSAKAKTALIAEGDFFPRQALEMPRSAQDRQYLGLGAGESFLLEEVDADVVVVEILNVHCPHCQRQSLAYNKLFELVEKDPRTRGHIKMLGVAVGNGWSEVDDFREIYEVAFPVVPDAQFRLHRAIGGSRTPFTIYVRQRGPGRGGVVAGTHLGVDNGFRQLFSFLKEVMTTEPAAFAELKAGRRRLVVAAQPILSTEKLEAEVRKSFIGLGRTLVGFRRVPLENDREVYTALFRGEKTPRRYFAEVVSRPSVCDVCHDLHFIYVFDRTGRVLRFIPLQLTKYGNKEWSEDDVAMMRRRVVGRYLSAPWRFNRDLDAVTSATITSAIIFDSLARGEELMKELRAQGLL